MFERFTERARRVIVLAQQEARMLNHGHIGTEHLLLGLIREGEGVAPKALESLGISLEAVRKEVEEIIGQGETVPVGHIPFTPRAKKVLELSLREAIQLGHNYIGTEHLLLGLVREGEGVAAQVLVKLGARLEDVRQRVIQLLSEYSGPPLVKRQGRFEDEMDDPEGVPRSVRFKAREVEKAYARLESKLRRAPTDSEVADYLGITVWELHDVVNQTSFLSAIGLEELVSVGDDLGERRALLAAAIDSLSERERLVLTLHHFEGLTLADVGDVLGLPESRVRAIHTKAVNNLRDVLAERSGPVGDEPRAPFDEVPRCPRCRRELGETGAVVTLELPVEGTDETRAVNVAFCRRCGTCLGTT